MTEIQGLAEKRKPRTARRWDDRPPAKRPRFKLAKLCALVALVLSLATAAEAGPIKLAWDPSPDPTVIGYVVLYGTAPELYTGTLDVGNQTSATVQGLADGQAYYFVVQAYSAAGRLSTFSNLASGAAANQPPHITNPGPQAGAEGASVTLALAGSDPDADPLTYTATGLPPPLVLDPTTGVISGTIAYDAAGTYNVTATVSDGAVSSTATFQWVVANTNQPPVVSVPDLSHGMGAAISYAIPATEPDGTLMTFAATGLPPGLALGPNAGLITGTLTDSAGIYPVTLIVTDESGRSTTVHFQWTVLASNDPPTLAAPGDQEGSLVNPTSLQLAGSDPDGNTLTYTTTGLPPGLVLDAHSGAIAGQPTTAGVSSVTVSVSDGLLASADRTFTWTIFANRAPTIQSLVNQSSLVNGLVNFTVQAADPEGTELTFSAVGLPSGLVLDSNTGAITGVPTQVGVQTVTMFVSDGTLSASQPFSWTILANGAPTLQNPGPQSSEEYRALPPFTVSSSDPDGNPLTFDAVGLPTGLWIDNESGIVSGLPTQVGTFTVTISVSDAAASASQTFQWVIFPNPPPTIEHPGAQTAVVGAPVFLPITAGDPNGHPFTLTASGLPPGLALDQTLMLILGTPTTAGTYPDARLTAFDGARFTSVSFTWTVAASPGPFTAVQANHSAPGGTPLSVTVPYTAPQLAGSLNVVAIGWHDTTAEIASVTDSRGNSYVRAVGPTVVSGVATQSIYYAANIVAAEAGGNVVEVTFTGPATSPDVRIAEYTGVRTVAPVADTAAAQGISGLSDSGFLTTTTPTALLVAANLVDAGTTTAAGENFASRIPSSEGSLLEDRTVMAPGSYNATAPVAPDGAWIMQLVAFRAVNTAPSLGLVSNQSHFENTEIVVWLAAVDPDGDVLTYDALGLPDGLGVTNASGLIAGHLTFESAGVRTVTATVSDGEVTTSQTFTWTVTNVNRAPALTAVADQSSAENATITLALAASDPDGTALTYSAIGLPASLSIDPATGLVAGTLTYTSAGTHAVTATVSDGSASTIRTFTWTVTNVNRAPVVTSIAGQTHAENAIVTLATGATDPDGETLTFSATGLPNGLAIDATTGEITGTLSYASAGEHMVTVAASDGTLPVSQTFTWTVTNVNREPDLTTVADRTDAENETVSLPVVATDPDGDVVTFSAIGLPAGLTINASTGLITGTLSYVSAGTHAVTVLASDGDLACGYVFIWTVTNVNRQPDLTTVVSRTDAENATVSLPLVASDPDGDSLTYSATGLPDGLTIHPATGEISGTLSYASAGTHPVTVTATDPGLATGSQTFTWGVMNVNQRPTLTDVPDRTDPENAVVAIPLAGADLDTGTTLTYSASPLPAGVTLNPATGLISGTLTYASAGSSTVTVSVSDGTDTVDQTFSWTVTNVNQLPTLTDVPDRTDPENAAVTISLAGADLDADTILTYSAGPLPAGITVSAATGRIEGTLTYASAGTYPVTVSVSDGTAFVEQTFTWTVSNVNQLPTLTDVPDRTDPENAVVAIPLAGADLDTGTTLTYSASPLPAGVTLNPATGLISGTLTYASAGIATVTASVSDGTASVDQTFSWTVTNVNQLPTLTDVPDRTDPENAAVTISLAGADLDADTILTYSAGPLPAGITVSAATGRIEGTLTYASAGTYPVTVSVSDGTAFVEQTFAWTVTNVNQPPTLTDVPDRTDPEHTVITIQLAGADLDAGTTLTYSGSPLPAGVTLNAATGRIEGTLTYASAGTYSVTVSVSDGTAFVEQTFTWTVSNVNQPPTLTDVPDRTDPENAVVAIPLAGADLDTGTTLTYSASPLPAGVTLNPATGLISGTLTYASAGSSTVTVSVSDGTDTVDQTFSWTVTNVNQLPTLTDVPDRTDPENAVVAIPLAGADLDTGTTLTYSASPLPAGVTLNPATGLISGTLTYASAGIATVTVSASDGTDTVDQTFSWTVTNVNQLPTLTDVPDRTDPENAAVTISLAGADLDADTILTYSASPLPAGITVNAATGRIEGTLTYASAGTYPVTVSVSDGTAFVEQTFAWTVTNVNQPPTFTDVPDRTDPENAVVAIPLAGADLDTGTTLTYSASPLPAGVTLNPATGLISGTLTYASAGIATVTASVSDGTASVDQTFSWTVTNVNQLPTLTDVPDRTDPENAAVTISLAGADLDADTILTYSAGPLPAGITANAATGRIEGTLTYASAGTYPVTVSVSDGTAFVEQTFTWTVTNVNQPPTLTDVPDRTDPENAVVAIPLAGADLDTGTTLTYSASPLPAGVTLNPATGLISGTLTYASAGSSTVTVSVSDGTDTVDQTFSWTVTNVNQLPTLTDVPDRTDPENAAVTISLAGADLDADTILTYSAGPLPAGITVSAATGRIEGTLTYASAGTYPVTVSVSDGTAFVEQTFTWTVSNVNQLPTLTDVPDRTDPENAVVAIPLAGADLDTGTTLTYSASPLPAGVTLNPATGLISGTLTYASAGSSTVTVSVSDGTDTVDQTFSWTVTNVNQLPTLTDIPDRTDPENSVIAIQLAAADLDAGTTLTYSAAPLPAGITLNPATGLIEGTLTYTSAGVHTVTVSVSDGTASATQTFAWTVTNVNQPPTLTDVPDRTDPENSVIAIQLAGADLDADTTFTYSASPLPAGVTLNAATGRIEGTLTYTSASVHTVTVSVSDGTASATQTFAWTVTNVNQPPTLTDVPDRTDPEHTVIAIQLAGADLDAGTTLTYSASPLPAGITANAATGRIEGTLTYASAGTYPVTVSVSDGTAFVEQTFTWTVSNVNQLPTLTDVPDRTDPENTVVAIQLAAADLDAGTTLTYSAGPLPAGVTLNPATGLISGTLTYTSAGSSTVTVSVSDGTDTVDQTFSWTVTNVNQLPTLTDVPDRTDPENVAVTISLAGADLDADTILTYSAGPLPAGITANAATGRIEGTLTYASAGTYPVTVSVSDGTAFVEQTFTWTVSNVNQPPTLTDVPDRTDPENAAVAISLTGADLDADTILTYSAGPLPAGVTLNAATGRIEGTLTYASAGSYPVTVSVSDGAASAAQTFTWTVSNVNQLPTLTDVPDRTDPENAAVTISLTGADLDADTTLTYSASPLPAGVTLNAATGRIEGTLTYASAGTYPVTVSVSDGTAFVEQTFTWTVSNVNQLPTLTDVPDRTDPENAAVTISLAGADLDADAILTYSAGPLPAGITVSAATGRIEGTLTYASAGSYPVTVSVSDGAASAEQTFTWTVTNVNQPPTLTDVPDRTDPENSVIAIQLAGADLDADTTFTYSASPLPAGVTLNAATGRIEGTLTYTSASVHTVTVSVSDGTASATQTFAWTVTNVNQPPTLTDVPDRTDPENSVIAIQLAGADLDADTTFTYSASPLPAGVMLNAATGRIEGTLTYTSASVHTVTVSVSDGTASATQTFAWAVTNVNQPPTLTDVPDRTDPENSVIAIQLAGADLDAGTTLTYSASPLPAGVTLNAATGRIEGTLTYASAGTYPVTVSVSDGTAFVEQTFTWTVSNVNQPPTLTDVPDRTDPENSVIAIQLAGADLDAGTTLTYSASPLPAGITLNAATGRIEGPLTYASAGTYPVTVSVSDGTAFVEQTFAWTVTNVNQPPTLTDVPDRTDPENAVVAIPLAGADLDTGTTLTYSASPLPAGVTLNPATGLISGTLTYASAGSSTVTVSVSDGTDTVDQTFSWTVTNVNQLPTLTDVPDRTDLENAAVTISLAGADLDADTILTYSAGPLPAGITVSAATGRIEGTLTYASAGSYPVTVSVSDGTAFVEQTFTWTVSNVNQLPTLTDVPDRTDLENAAVTISLTGADLDADTILTYSAGQLPAGVTLNAATGRIEGTLTYTSASVHTVTVSVSDGTASATQTFAWTVTNVNQPPTLTDVPDRTDPENSVIAIQLAGADLDAGTTLTYSASPLPAGITLNPATGLISGTLTYASAGTATVTVSVSDGTASADQAFTWTVTNVNQPPTLTDVPDRTDPEHTVIAIQLAGADLDAGTTLTYSASPLPAGVTLNPATGLISGTLTYTSAGVHTITVSVSDGTASADQTFTWTVTNVNQPPTLTDVPDRTEPENAVVAIQLAGADLDAGTTLTYSASPLPAGITLNPATGLISGTLTYASAGTATVTVSVSDGTASAAQTFTWTITNVNQPPVLTALAGRTDAENAPVSLPLVASDPDGDALTYSASPLPAGITLNPATGLISGTLTYTSAGVHTITVSVSDGTASADQTFTWTVTNVNQPPTLTDVPDRTEPENAVVAIQLAGADLDAGTTLTYSASPLPAGITLNPATGLISGTLTYASAGTATVTVSVSDGTASAAQTFTWTITNVNQPPVLTALAGRTDAENAPVSLPLVASDPDGDALTYSATGLPSGLAIDATTGAISGTLTYTSAGAHSVTVTATDPASATGSRTFTWTVTNVNQAPVLTALAGRTDAENAPVSLPLAASDPDGDALTYSATGLPSGLAINATTGAITGTLTYTSAGAHSVTVTATDHPTLATGTATFIWTVTNVNQPPTLTDVPDRSDSENTLIAIQLAGADLDTGTTLTYSASPLPAGVTLNPATGLISGTLTYTSAGVHTITVSVSDGTASADQTFTWTVTNVNQPPTLTDVPDRTEPENAVVAIQLAGADLDAGTTLTYSASPLPAGITLNPATGLISGTLTYASAGTATVTVSVSDGTASAAQTFTWTITNVNQPPVLTALAARTDAENATISLPLVASDPDSDSLTYTAAGLPNGLAINATTGAISGTLTYTSAGAHSVTVTATDPASATGSRTFTWTVTNVNQAPVLTALAGRTDAENATVLLPLAASDPDSDSLTYTAAGLPNGLAINATTGAISGTLTYTSAGAHSVTVTATDHPTLATGTATFIWTVTNVNQPPTLTDVPDRSDSENTLIAIQLAGADLDTGTTLTYSADPLPAGVTLNPTTGLISGTLTYASAGTSTVTVSVSDGTASADQTFMWTVTNVNQPPALTDVPDRTDPENTAITIQLAGADLDADTTLTYSAAPLPAGIALNPATGRIEGTLTYTSAGVHTVTVSVSDGTASAVQTFAWTVTNVNQPPVLTALAGRTDAENTTVSVPLAASDPDGDTLTFSATGLPNGLAINATTGTISGTLTYTSAGTHPVTVTATDPALATGSQTFTWTVTDVSRAPVVTAIADQTTAENAAVTLATGATDPDSDPLTFSATGLPSGLTINATTGAITGTLTYTSAGTHPVTVTATDPASATGSTTFTWAVTDVNRAPVLTALGHLSTTTEMGGVALHLEASDPDEDEGALTYGATGLPPGLSVNPTTGLIAGTPSSPGVYPVTATATDASLSASQSFIWTLVAKPMGRVKFIQAHSSAPTTSGTAVTVPLAAAQAAGHLNVVVVGWRDATTQVQAVTDTTGNLYQLAVGPTVAAGVGTQAIYYAANIVPATAGTNAVVVTFTAPPTRPDIRVAAYAGIDLVNPIDATAAAQGTGATLDSGFLSTTFADDLLLGASLVAESSTTAPGAGYATRLLSSAGNLLEERIVTTVGSYHATANLAPSSGWIMQLVAFRDPNHAPVLTSPGDQISTEHESIWVPLAGHDPDDEPVTYRLSGQPASLTVNASTGVISGTLSYASAGTYTVTATVSDGPLASSRTFTWTVTDRNPALTRTTPGDFTGDGKADLTRYRPATGLWSILKSGMSSATWSYQWGLTGDLPVPGDYDGDGRADVTVYRPSTGTWFILKSSTSYTTWNVLQWGMRGDVPVPGDYDGDGKTDVAVYRPSNGMWYLLKSSTSFTTWNTYQWGGTSGDAPAQGDYDGDGRTDITVFRPSTGTWFILRSSANYTASSVYQWGGSGDMAVPGDYDGDGKTDMTAYRPSTGTWWILKSSTNYTTSSAHQWGVNGDKPVPGDYDGDGRTDVTVYRPSTGAWWILKSSTDFTTSDVHQVGSPGDIPVF